MITTRKRELDPTDGLKLSLPKEVCSWMDSSALRRSSLTDNYITASVTPSGRFVYFIYMYEIEVFNTFCGTKKEFPTALEIIKYIPLGDISGYLIQLEHNKLYAREVIFHFATGFLEEVSKHLLIEGCDKLRDVDSISYLESTKHLIILYNDLTSALNFRCFNVGSWTDAAPLVEQFGDGQYTKFPCFHNNYAYAFPNRQITSILDSALRFGSICEVNPRVASTIPVAPIQAAIQVPPPQQNIQQNAQLIQNFQLQQNAQMIQNVPPLMFNAGVVGGALGGVARQVHVQQMRQHAHNLRQAQIAIQQIVAPPPPPPIDPPRRAIIPRYRVTTLINDLTCVGIPSEIARLENAMEKFEFQWLDERLYMLWSIGIRHDRVEDPNRNYTYNYYDFETFRGGFVNYMAIFDIRNLTWYPIKIGGLSPRTDAPLLMFVTADAFLTLFISQLSLPFKWSRMRVPPPVSYDSKHSILSINAQHASKSYVYRIPINEPDSLLNLAQGAFNRTYPDWTKMNHDQLQERYGRFLAYDHLFHNDNNALLEVYVYDVQKFGSARAKIANQRQKKSS